jgi:hypothetical protein
MSKLRYHPAHPLFLIPALGGAMFLICTIHCALPH